MRDVINRLKGTTIIERIFLALTCPLWIPCGVVFIAFILCLAVPITAIQFLIVKPFEIIFGED